MGAAKATTVEYNKKRKSVAPATTVFFICFLLLLFVFWLFYSAQVVWLPRAAQFKRLLAFLIISEPQKIKQKK
jgi:hypothetical protein